MKKNLLLIGIVLLTILSCSKSEIPTLPEEKPTGNISLTFTPKTANTLASSKSLKVLNDVPFQIVATITDVENNIVINNESYTLTNFNNSFITSSIELPIGDYKLTGFNVVNSDNQVIFSAPLADSEFADLVNTPLPISFSVTESNSNDAPKVLSPEVLKVETTDTPAQFGYVSFTFNVIDTANLFIQVLENGDNINTDGAIAKIGNIPDNDFITRTLLDGVNTVKIPLNDFNSNSIELEITYPGYDKKNISISPEELNKYSITEPFIVSFDTVVTSDPAIFTSNDFPLITATQDLEFSLEGGIWNGFIGDLLDIDALDTNNNNYIIATGGSSSLLIIDSNLKTGNSFTLKTNDLVERFSEVNIANNTIILSGFGGDLYVQNNFSPLSFTKYKYEFIRGDNVFTYNNSIFAINGNQLYRSNNSGQSFTLINNNLPFTEGNTDIVFARDRIYAYDVKSKQVYSSGILDGEFFEDIFVTENIYTNMSKIDNNLLFSGIGLDHILISKLETTTFEKINLPSNKPNDSFAGLSFVDGQYILAFNETIYNSFTGNNDFTKLKDFPFITKSIASGNNQEVWGIDSGNTVYSNLRF